MASLWPIPLSSESPRHVMPLSMSLPTALNSRHHPATLHYGDGEFAVLGSGDHVVCAISGAQIGLLDLRYWSVERQQAYAGPLEYMAAERDA